MAPVPISMHAKVEMIQLKTLDSMPMRPIRMDGQTDRWTDGADIDNRMCTQF